LAPYIVYVDQDAFRIGIKLIEGGIHGLVVGEVFEFINLRPESIAAGLRMIHGIHFGHNLISFPVDLRIPLFHRTEKLGIPLGRGSIHNISTPGHCLVHATSAIMLELHYGFVSCNGTPSSRRIV
jgi:hypothetical protein